MKKMYVPKTLSEYLGESNSITLKRKYGMRPTITAGTNAPLRNQVLSFVAENASVSKIDLKRFIVGLKEGGSTPAAANMFIKRNAKYFVTESRNGVTYFKLSNIGQRLVNKFVSVNDTVVNEAKKDNRFKAERGKAANVESEEVEEEYSEDEYADIPNKMKNESLRGRFVKESMDDDDKDNDDLDEVEDEDMEASDYEGNEDLDDEDMDDEGPADEVEFDENRFNGAEEAGDHAETDQFEYEEDDEKIVLTYWKTPQGEDEELEDEEFEDEELEDDEDIEDIGEDLPEDEDYPEDDEDLDDEDLDDEDMDDEDMDDEDEEELNEYSEDEDDLDNDANRPEEDPRKYDFKDKGRPGLNDESNESLAIKDKMKKLIENLKAKNTASYDLFEAEKEADEEDELKDEDLENVEGEEETPEGEVPEENPEEDNVEKVEITEFIITVDDVDSAIDELSELGVQAERVPVEAPETEVPAEVEEPEMPEETPEEVPAEEPVEGAEVPAAPEGNVKESMNEADDEQPEEDLGASDDLSLGDQGEEAPELTDQPTEEVPAEGEEPVEATTEFEENKIKVSAESWPTLKTWLEEKGVDVAEMFGGEIEMEEVPEEGEAGPEETTSAAPIEVDDSEIDFSGIGEDDDTKVEDEDDEEDEDEDDEKKEKE